MRKLKFLGLFIAVGLLMQSAYATCSVPARQTGQQVCMVVGSSNLNSMNVYTCQSNGTWVLTGGKCGCPGMEVDAQNSSGVSIYCMGTYTTSQANANMSYASNGFSKSAQ